MTEAKLDRFSAGYVKYLRERSELDMQMHAERAEYDPNKPGAYQKAISKRVKRLESLSDRISRFSGTGVAQIYPIPGQFVPQSSSFTVPVPYVVDREICDLNQTLNIPSERYVVLDQNHSFMADALPGKTVSDRASANPNHSDWDAFGLIFNGYRTSITIPAAEVETSVRITSNLAADLGWVEANAIGNNWVSSVSAVARSWLAGPSVNQTASPVTLVNFNANNGQVLSHNDMPTTIFNVTFDLSASIPAGNGATFDLFETIRLHASTPNGHAYIDGVFTWQPARVTMRQGCRPRLLVQSGYWNGP